jgi:signal transduction histidine kinase
MGVMAEHLARRVRALAGRPTAQDVASAAAVLVLCALVNAPTDALVRSSSVHGGPALWWVATVVAAVGIALRRRWSLAMLVVCTGTVVFHLALRAPLMIIDLCAPILLYTVAVRHRGAVSGTVLAGLVVIAAAASAFAVTKVVLPADGPRLAPPNQVPKDPPPGIVLIDREVIHTWGITWNDLPALMVTLIASWAIGSGTRSRRAHFDELRARAADLERQRDQQAALAVAAERSRINRELHDVVAHGLSVMVIQAQGGAAALDNRPADTRAALEAIVKTGRDSLTDMRRVLATVDRDEDAWRPRPGLAALPVLLDQVREAGTQVRLHVMGEPAALPSTVDLSAYRIVQEALTNTMKHAGSGAQAEVVVSYSAADVQVEVTDDGTGTTRINGASGGGNGLRGMRERVRLLGGSFEAGRRQSGGFAVRAVLPLAGQQP